MKIDVEVLSSLSDTMENFHFALAVMCCGKLPYVVSCQLDIGMCDGRQNRDFQWTWREDFPWVNKSRSQAFTSSLARAHKNQSMGMDLYDSSRAARALWEGADAHRLTKMLGLAVHIQHRRSDICRAPRFR